MGVNLVFLVGHVGQVKEPQTFLNDKKVINFTLATSKSYKDSNGEKKTITEWHNCTAYRGLVDVIHKYVKKGSQLHIQGELKTDSYDKNGEKRYSTKVVVNNLEMLGGKQNETPAKEIKQGAGDFEETDDLPF